MTSRSTFQHDLQQEEWYEEDGDLGDGWTGRSDEDDGTAAFRARRKDLASSARRMEEIAGYSGVWPQYLPDGSRPADPRILSKAPEWALSLRDLFAATVARMDGDAAGSRGWIDDVYGVMLSEDHLLRDLDLGHDLTTIERWCKRHDVESLFLTPAVLRQGNEAKPAVDAILKLGSDTTEAPDLTPLRDKLERLLGQWVDVFLYEEIDPPLLPELLISLETYGPQLYSRPDSPSEDLN